MRDDETRELLGAYALDAVSDDERRAVDALVARDPDAAAELAELRAAAADLATALAAEPPADLRGRVLAAAAATPQGDAQRVDEVRAADESEVAAVVPLAPRRRTPARWAAIAAAVAIGAAIPAGLAVQQHRELDAMRTEQAHLAAMLKDPDAEMMHADVAGGGTASALVATDGAVFMTQDLPDPAPGHVYQLWVVATGDPVSAGMMAEGGSQTAMVVDDFVEGAALAMTLEPAGGSPQPTTDPLVVLAS
ncbi:anti-sigma factor [Cellulomonas sp. DKR-3]|uniref:Regulator of SigK n=1 Tax=Cellulomonas fulva TaxID=2835530 RepID=A0ABS5TWD7_9CELL|nr:anti-sigma factor [Cellulomonas fulva]MBT0993451.1 anti-sigma factor [Cellulomonas fulva]